MAPRTKSKKKVAPIANGDNQTNNSPVAVKKPVRGRKAAVEEKNAEVVIEVPSNGNAESAIPSGTKPAQKAASVAKIVSPSKNDAKNAKEAPKKLAAVRKTKAAVKENYTVDEASDKGVEKIVVPATGRGNSKATKKVVEPKIVTKARGRATAKQNDIVEASNEPEIKESIVPATGNATTKASKKAVEPKLVAKPKRKAAGKEADIVEPAAVKEADIVEKNGENPDAPATNKLKPKATKKAAEVKVVAKPAAKIEKKTKAPAKSASTMKNAESAEVSLPQPSSSTSVDDTKGRKKRENAKPIDTIAESPRTKRGKKQTVITVNNEAIDVKVDAPKRTAFSKKSKNISENENSNGIDEVIPAESTAAKGKKPLPKPAAAEKPIVVVEKRVINKRKAAEKAAVKEQSEDEFEEIVPKKARKKVSAADAKTKTKKAPAGEQTKMNATNTEYAKINFVTDKDYNMKICSFNVAGLRAFVEKGGLEYFEHEQPNIICLQVNSKFLFVSIHP